MALTAKQEYFVQEYLIAPNATQAAFSIFKTTQFVEVVSLQNVK